MNAPRKEKLTEWILPHALEVICGKVSDEMDVMNEAEKLPGLDAITPEFIEAGARSVGIRKSKAVLRSAAGRFRISWSAF